MVGTQGVGGFGNRALVADLGEVVAGGQIYVNNMHYIPRHSKRRRAAHPGSTLVAYPKIAHPICEKIHIKKESAGYPGGFLPHTSLNSREVYIMLFPL